MPLTDLLALLRERGLPIGLREHLAVGRLLARWDDADIGSLRSALSALLARNPDEVMQVREAFDELYGEPAEAPPPPPPLPEKRGAWRWAVAAGLLLALAVVVGARMWPHEPPEPQPVRSQAPAPGAGEKPPPEIDDTFRVPDRRRAAAGAAGLAGGVLLGLWWLRLRRAAGQAARRRWREQVEEMAGPQGYEIALGEPLLPLPAPVLDDVAALLGRRTPAAPRWGELDVDRTLERTLRAGLAPDPTFRVRAAAPPLLVLEDIGSEMLPWEGRIAGLLTALAARGVALDRWRFHADAGSVFRAPGDPEISLQQLARSSGDKALLVISTGEGLLQERGGRTAPWVERLAAWPRRAWLHPVSDPGLWRPALRKVPTAVWPLTSDGLLAAARHLGHGRPGPAARGTARALADRPVTPADVDRLRALLAMAPRHDPDLLELLRLRFCPHVPAAALVDALNAPPPASPVRLGPDPAEVHAFLADLLAGSEPEETGSPAHARWRLDRALQEIRVPGRAERAAAELSDLARGPLAHLVEDSVAELSAPGAEPSPPAPLTRELRKRVLTPVRRRAAAAPLGRWNAAPGPGWAALAAGLVVLLLASLVLPSLSPAFTKEEPARQEVRYRLTVADSGPGRLSVTADIPRRWAAVPKVAVVYGKSGQENLSEWDSPLRDELRGRWVYLRDAKPDSQGGLGISPPVPLPALQPEPSPGPLPTQPVKTSGADTTPVAQPTPTNLPTTTEPGTGGETDGDCPSVFAYPSYQPRGCPSSCGLFDAACYAQKVECERLKEQERQAYEAAKANAQASFSAQKAACEERRESKSSGKPAKKPTPQGSLGRQDRPAQVRYSDADDITWSCSQGVVRPITYELKPGEEYVSAKLEVLALETQGLKLQSEAEPTYDERSRVITVMISFKGTPRYDDDCYAKVRLAVTVRPKPPTGD